MQQSDECKCLHLTFSARCRWEAPQGDIQMQMPEWGWCTPSANEATGASPFSRKCMKSHNSHHSFRVSDLLVDGEEFGCARVLRDFSVHSVVAEHVQRAGDVESLINDLIWQKTPTGCSHFFLCSPLYVSMWCTFVLHSDCQANYREQYQDRKPLWSFTVTAFFMWMRNGWTELDLFQNPQRAVPLLVVSLVVV